MKSIITYTAIGMLALCCDIAGAVEAEDTTKLLTGNELHSFKALMEKTADRQIAIKSLSYTGVSKMEIGLELKKLMDADDNEAAATISATQCNEVFIQEKGNLMRITLTPTMKADYESVTYIATEDNFVVETHSLNGANTAMVAHRAPDARLESLSPMFAEYDFLRDDLQADRTPAWNIADLKNWRGLWNQAIIDSDFTSIRKNSNEEFFVSINRKWGTAKVVFRLVDGILFPMQSTLLDVSGRLIRQVSVDENFFVDGLPMPLAKNMQSQLPLFPKLRERVEVPLTTIEIIVKDIKVDPVIPEETFTFDPATTDKIWDADNKLLISVPR